MPETDDISVPTTLNQQQRDEKLDEQMEEKETNEPTTKSPNPSPPDDDQDSPPPALELTILLHNKPITLPFHSTTATIQDLSETVSTLLQIPPSNQKFLITPKTGLLKPPFPNPSLPLSDLTTKKILLLGTTTTELSNLETALESRRLQIQARQKSLSAGRKTTAYKSVDSAKTQAEARYTFHSIKPLPYLPNPARSKQYLETLASDPGIKAAMRKHQFSVGLLTEMDPVMHTTHESKTLGLNRNRGEVIELRLRTDGGDGYRDYKVIRKTLCHELAHNVHGEHDRKFWDLMKVIETEVERGDWTRGGRSVGGQGAEFYNPGDEGVGEGEFEDEGGWVGGEYVLGGGGSAGEGLSRRDVIARAAEERVKRQREAGGKQGEGAAE
ncbi:hypothetical protein MBLNU230_g8619t1 [Neophaeotheca triangularis]